MFLFTLYGNLMFSSTTYTISLPGHHDICVLMKITDNKYLQLNRNQIILKTVIVLGDLGEKDT